MGQVFLARSRGGRLVAVKVVRPELAGDAQFRRRFAIEVEAARKVGGYFTAQVVDADTAADPPWLVTAYIPGPSLQEAVSQSGPLPEEALGLLAGGLAEGLTAVHSSDLVHRDLKPGNVLLAADGPRLIDFGIARAVDDTQLTSTGMIVGTPGFMAPEHLLGRRIGPEIDVFALGAVLAYAATGRLPFGTGAALAVNYRAVHESADLEGLPASLADLIGQCLAKNAADRPLVHQILDRVQVPDTAGGSWLPPRMATLIDERDVSFPDSVPSFFDEPLTPEADFAPEADRQQAIRRGGSDDEWQRKLRAKYEREAWQLLRGAEELCRGISDVRLRAEALAQLAAAVHSVDRVRSDRLAAEAQEWARSGEQSYDQAKALAKVAAHLAATHPTQARAAAERAETFIEQDPRWVRMLRLSSREIFLSVVAEAVAAVRPARAEQLARSIKDPSDRKKALRGIVEPMAQADPRRAESLTWELADEAGPLWTDLSLREIAEAALISDPDHAEAVACKLSKDRDRVLARMTDRLAVADPVRAEQMARAISDATKRKSAFSSVARAMWEVDLDSAVRIASAGFSYDASLARDESTRRLAAADPERAERKALAIQDEEDRADALLFLFEELHLVRPALSMHIARAIPFNKPCHRAAVLLTRADTLLTEDPDRAQQLHMEAQRIADQSDGAEFVRYEIAKQLSCIDPAHVSRTCEMARAVPDPQDGAHELLDFAALLHDAFPAQVETVLDQFTQAAREISDSTQREVTLKQGIDKAAEIAPQWAVRLARSVAGEDHDDPRRVLTDLAKALVDFEPQAAKDLAVEAVHAARAAEGGDEYNIYAMDALVTLTRIDTRAAISLAVSHQAYGNPSKALWEVFDRVTRRATFSMELAARP